MDNISLDDKLNYIGMRISSGSISSKNDRYPWVDIEETIYEATLECSNDPRLFMVLCSWVKVHGEHVVIEKLIKFQKNRKSVWLIALAIFAVSESLHKWKSLVKKVDDKYSLSTNAIASQTIQYKGIDPRFADSGFLIASGSLRVRESDVKTVEELLESNPQYRNRFIIGSNWRSDVITAIQMGLRNPYQIAKATKCSQPSVYKIFKEYSLVSKLDT